MEIRVDTEIKAASGTTTTIMDAIGTAAEIRSPMDIKTTGNIEALRCTDATDIVWRDAIIGVTGFV
ncbi:MAG TPA: hypothetical protein VGQ55_11495 [Pyrinomonadaceae bacterium]|jgi:hypothetical protein|nr:hypothetical protein [Pyrinomonadaceae bacterium]